MSGHGYGEAEPIEACGLCGADSYAEFCDVGVGYVQISPFQCCECGAELNPLIAPEVWFSGWRPAEPQVRTVRVTGYYISDRGVVYDMTFKDGHKEFCERRRTTEGTLQHSGWVRITNLEGYAIDLPPFMTDKVRRALKKVTDGIEAANGDDVGWGMPYVMEAGGSGGREMTHRELMVAVSRLPASDMRKTG